jgi:hypothetical protein
MKTAVLEHPRIASEKRFNDIANTPLWSCLMGGYAAAALDKAGFDPHFIDDATPGASFEETLNKLLPLNLDLLCVNAVYLWERTPALFDFLTQLPERGFSGHINLFGFFPSLIYRTILSVQKEVDSIAVGEFEHTLPELAIALMRSRSLEEIDGLALRTCLGDEKSRMRTPEKNPDLFAFPKRSSLEGTVSILASRGCYNHCSFCPVPSFYNRGNLWRGRSVENIAAEMAELVAQGVKRFYFCDANFIGPGKSGKKRVMELMDLIHPMNISFGMETRPQDLDDEVLEKLVSAGFESLLMGMESGSQDVLKRINKSTEPDLASHAIELCRKHGIEPEIGFLMFVPDSRLNDLKENMRFLVSNNLLDRLARTANLLSHTQIVLAGTSAYAHFEKEGLLEKQGLFNFEAEVKFTDPAVKWVAILLTFACHIVLKSMGRASSPIFWQKDDNVVSRQINTYLVELCHSLIEQAAGSADFDNETIEHRKDEIRSRLAAALRQPVDKIAIDEKMTTPANKC